MKLQNETGFSAELFRTCIDDHRMAAAVVARITFEIRDQTVSVAAEQSWPVSSDASETPYGVMEGDQVLRRGGVDLFLFGSAVSPARRPTTRMEVGLDVGRFSRRVIVTGDRVWRRAGSKLAPSAPVPFTTMPLALKRAFGGEIAWDGLAVKHPDNPDGIGFYSTEEDAVGKPLPNVEEADMPVQAWSDRPLSAGLTFCSIQSHARLSNAIPIDAEGRVQAITPLFFNAAFPRMIAPSVLAGDAVRLWGVAADGAMTFAIPSAPARVRLRFDDLVKEHALKIEQVGFEVEKSRLFVSYRFGFRYAVVTGQLRSCELLPA